MVQEDISSAVDRWLSGDDAAYEPVFRFYYQRLLSFAVRFLKDRPQAEEITMDTLLKAWQNRGVITSSRTFQSYIFVILRNRLVSITRKKKPLLVPIDGLENEWEAESPESIRTTREAVELYQGCISRLSPKRREVFLLSREEGLTHAEIASKLNISVFTVKNHIKAALQSLKTELSSPEMILVLYGTFLLDNASRF